MEVAEYVEVGTTWPDEIEEEDVVGSGDERQEIGGGGEGWELEGMSLDTQVNDFRI